MYVSIHTININNAQGHNFGLHQDYMPTSIVYMQLGKFKNYKIKFLFLL
jgi:hypothetical protein